MVQQENDYSAADVAKMFTNIISDGYNASSGQRSVLVQALESKFLHTTDSRSSSRLASSFALRPVLQRPPGCRPERQGKTVISVRKHLDDGKSTPLARRGPFKAMNRVNLNRSFQKARPTAFHDRTTIRRRATTHSSVANRRRGTFTRRHPLAEVGEGQRYKCRHLVAMSRNPLRSW